MSAAPAARPALRPPPAAVRPTVWPGVAVFACVAAGLGLRAWAYFRDPSLWGDEAMLALNVVHRPVGKLLTPLDLNQGAPVGYLVLVRLLVQAFGPGEWVLRLPSFVAGVLAVPVFARLAYRALPLAGARLSVALFALSPHVVGYCAEFKQYELDVLLAVGLTAAGLTAWRSGTPGALARLAAAGAAAVWLSHPAAFALGGVGLALALDPQLRHNRCALVARAAVGAAWAASFLACYFLFTRRLGGSRYLADYWAGAFWPVPPREPGDVAWLAHHLIALFEVPGGFSATGFGSGGLALACAAVGVLALTRTDRRVAAVVIGPVGLALAASAAGKYPFAGRLMLFAVPGLLLAVGHGLAVLGAHLRPVHALAGPVVAAALVAPVLSELAAQARRPAHAEDVRGALEYVARNWRPGDRLFVTAGGHPAAAYYLPRFGLPADRTDVIHPTLTGVRPGPAWVVVAHAKPADAAALGARLEARGSCAEVLAVDGALVLRCEVGR